MRAARPVAVWVLVSVVAAGAAALAAEEKLNAIAFPEKKSVEVAFAATDRTPKGAAASAEVTTEKGQTTIEVVYKKMQPALLFGGDVTSYVTWAVVPDGTAENLGELRVRNTSGYEEYRSAQKIFALMVTAELSPLVRQPSGMVMFTSLPSKKKQIENRAFSFTGFTTYLNSAVPSIAGLKFKEKEAIELLQAKKAVEVGDRMGASQYNAPAMEKAHTALDAAIKEKSGKKMIDAAGRSMGFSAEALRDMVRIKAEQEQAAERARQQAEKDALSQRAASAETGLKVSEEENARLAAEKAAIAADRERLRQERDELQDVLEAALSRVAEVTDSVRGTIVNLPGILFDVSKAALKPASQVSVAKLAGILLVYQRATLEIEGHTDSTGTEATNMKLSEARAKAVYDFLLSQGIDAGRMKFSGLGPANPLATNDTPEGRAKNRRVEVIIADVVKAAPQE